MRDSTRFRDTFGGVSDNINGRCSNTQLRSISPTLYLDSSRGLSKINVDLQETPAGSGTVAAAPTPAASAAATGTVYTNAASFGATGSLAAIRGHRRYLSYPVKAAEPDIEEGEAIAAAVPRYF